MRFSKQISHKFALTRELIDIDLSVNHQHWFQLSNIFVTLHVYLGHSAVVGQNGTEII